MTVYLLEIMALGLVLFVIAILWDKHQREKVATTDEPHYVLALRGEDYAYFDVVLRRAQPHQAGTAPDIDLPRKTSAK